MPGTTPDAEPGAAPRSQDPHCCDIVMKGGITSGEVSDDRSGLVAALQQEPRTFEDGVPRPQPELRLRPRI